MEDLVLSFNWQNLFTVWLMVVILALIYVIGGQIYKTASANNAQS
jgi:hypothetical protein